MTGQWLGAVVVVGGLLGGCVATTAPAPEAAAVRVTPEPTASAQDSREAPGEAPSLADPTARPWLGIGMKENKGGGGVVVQHVYRGSPAAAAGIQDGDVIVQIEERIVQQPGEVSGVVLRRQVGDSISIKLRRQGAEQRVKIKLEVFPGSEEVVRRERVGAAAPALVGLSSVQGSAPLTLEGLRGKVVVLDFWASWCTVCKQTVPILNGWHDRLGAQGVVVVGVSSDDFATAAKASAGFAIRYPVAVDEDEKVFSAYGASSLPSLFVLDRRGVVRAVEVGFSREGMARTERLLVELLDEKG